MRRVNRLIGSMAVVATIAGSVGAASAAAGFSYTFDTGNQNWRTFTNTNGAQPAGWTASGGNLGGAITQTISEGALFLTPPVPEFEGDYSSNFGGTLSVDVKSSQTWTFGFAAFLLDGISADTLCVGDNTLPTTTYHRYQYTLNGTQVLHSDCATPATDAQVAQMLANLQQIQFTGYGVASGSLTTTIDNVSLSGGGPPPTTDVPRTLTLSYSKKSKAFKGKLKAPLAPTACAGGQQVTVFKKQTGPDKKLGSPTTSASGAYTLKNSGKHGTYYATVANSTSGLDICKAAKSGTVQIA